MALRPVVLKGEQKKVLFLPPTEPIQIKGVAGSGKTTVALYRAKHLIETQGNLFQEARVVIFTYNKTLTEYIKALSPHVPGGYRRESEDINTSAPKGLNVEIINFHKWAFHFLQSNGYSLYKKTAQKQTQVEILESLKKSQLIANSSITKKKAEFFLEEISWMKGKMFESEAEYLTSKRSGRGSGDRVTRQDKQAIWKLFLGYNTELKNRSLIDFDDYALLVIKAIESNPLFIEPYTHLIIDEAQDLNKAQIIALSKIVSKETKSISIIADAAQRIFKSGFTWSEVGINVKGGRTIELKKNYRSTVQIVNAALSLLSNEPDQGEFTTVETARKGEAKPILGYFPNWKQEAIYVHDEIKKLKKIFQSIAVIHRNRAGVQDINTFLTQRGHETEVVYDYVDFESDLIKVSTLSSIKGLEFDVVFVIDCNEDIIPYPDGFNEENDEYHISTERRLLYTSMTRAKERLYLLCSGHPTIYFEELNKKLFEEIHITEKGSDGSDDLPF
jgi:superfamily I DNA/RNA helicase